LSSLPTSLPASLRAMLGRGLDLVPDPAARAAMNSVTYAVAAATFERWLSQRSADDNRVEHEFVVFGAAMRIGVAERLPLDGMLAVICATFLHDTHAIQRITERMIREAAQSDPELAAQLMLRKSEQRTHHMQMGARNAGQLLGELNVVSAAVRERCQIIIASRIPSLQIAKPWCVSRPTRYGRSIPSAYLRISNGPMNPARQGM